jgi:hypothetical protein
MPSKVTAEQRQAVLRMLAQGQDRDTIAAAVGVTPGQVSAISAHVKMGTYALPEPDASLETDEPDQDVAPPAAERTTNLLRQLRHFEGAKRSNPKRNRIID